MPMKPPRRPELRQRAEALLGDEKLPARDPVAMVHELEVHRVELELQNEELRAARHELETTLERYTELFEFAPLGYALVDHAGVIQEINHAGGLILGEARHELNGQSFLTYVTPDSHDPFRTLLSSALNAVARGALELELSCRGAPLLARFRATAMTHGQEGVLLAFEDVTENHTRELELSATQRALSEAGRRKDEFLGALSHELRNPLAPIRNSLHVLSHAGLSAPAGARAFAVIERQINHLSRLVDDLLDVTRIARGKVELQSQVLNLSDLVRRTLEDHEGDFELAGVQLIQNLDPGPFWVEVDPARMVQVLSNLLGNALKFTPKGGTVTVTLRELFGQLELSVTDNGAGIEPALLPRVFDSFVQGKQSLARARGGLGLGLAMVKGFIELLGGQVSLESKGLGKGSAAIVRLPVGVVPAPSAPRQKPHLLAPPKRVLLIEDNVDAADSLRDLLELQGHEVKVAYDGPKGLELARAFSPDVVLCDIGLPGMNGYEVAKAVRSDHELDKLYLVALSGYARPEDVREAREAGFDRHLAKPPPIELVEQVLNEVTASPPAESPAAP